MSKSNRFSSFWLTGALALGSFAASGGVLADDGMTMSTTDAAPHLSCEVKAFTQISPTRWSGAQTVSSVVLMGGVPGRPPELRSDPSPASLEQSATVDYGFGNLEIVLRRGLGGDSDRRTANGDWQSRVVLSGDGRVDVYDYGTVARGANCPPRNARPAVRRSIASDPIVDDRAQPRDYDRCVRMVQKRTRPGQEPEEGYLRISCRQLHNPDRDRERALERGSGGGGAGGGTGGRARPAQ